MKNSIFKGVGTAIITPFSDGKIDLVRLSGLIEMQIKGGVDCIVVGGTTGEAATLSDKERYELYREAKRMIDGRVKLILGTGTNDTSVAMRHTEFASKLGCDGVLIVTPYYNKGTEEGILRHYLAIADSSDVPMLLYNVPSRTGVCLSLELISELSKCEQIVGIKEASDSAERLIALSAMKDKIKLYAGNDSQIYTVLSLGGEGVISVVSNIMPKTASSLCKQFFAGNRETALEIQRKMLPVINNLFLETNPAPIKYAMSRLGLCSSEMRLPMWLPTQKTREKIDEMIRRLGSELK